MDFTQETFDFLKERNVELETQVKLAKEFSNVDRLNESQKISQIGSWSWDIESGTVIWSDMMYRLLGIESNQNPPTYDLALHHVHTDDKEKYENALAKAMANKEDYYFENRVVKNDKSIIYVVSRGACICNEENELIRMVGTVQDVTLLKQLVETNKQLEQFANILSHDFKTPVRSIVSFVGLIKKKSFRNLTVEGKQYFEFVEKGARRLSTLVDDILEYSKLNPPSLKIEKIPVSKLVRGVLFDLNAREVEKESDISIGWLPETINGDSVKIRQVLQNLISNAIKYSSLETRPTIDIYCEEEEAQFVFYIKDNGIGVEEKYVDKIFEPYMRVKSKKYFSGTGIGLSISKRIIQLHNGTIGYFSNKEKGSCFYFSIPK